MEVAGRELSLVERGPLAALPGGDLPGTALLEAVEALAANGIMDVTKTAFATLVEPKQFVGTLRVRGATVTIAPKAGLAFAKMTEIVRAARRREAAGAEAATTYAGEAALNPYESLAICAEEVVSAGLPIRYGSVERETSSPRGRILVGKTMRRFGASGIKHRVVCAVPKKQLDPRPQMLLQVAGALALPHLRPPFRDLLEVALEIAVGEKQIASLDEARQLVADVKRAYVERPDVVRLAQVAGAVLGDETEDWCVTGSLRGALYSFVNVDDLWELACYEMLRRFCSERPGFAASFHPFRRGGVTLLDGGGPEIDPDVMMAIDANPKLIIDAKNKVENAAIASDVYQMVAYVDRAAAPAGLLVYLSPDVPWFRRLGRAKSGALIGACGLSAAFELDYRSAVLEMLGSGVAAMQTAPVSGVA